MSATYLLPVVPEPREAAPKTIYVVASGDLRPSANLAGWGAQQGVEADFGAAVAHLGWRVERAHPFDPDKGHGFIDGQRYGMDVFREIPTDAPVAVVEAVWQYSHHVLAGLRDHTGPVLVVANWAAEYPGLVGALNLASSLTKAGVGYSFLWSGDFTDDFAVTGLRRFVETGTIGPDLTHVRDLPALGVSEERDLGRALAAQLLEEKAVIGIFDEGCMGMFNAVFEDDLLNAIGIYKERLSQSALYAEMLTVPAAQTQAVRDWLDEAGMTFRTGPDPATDLTDAQLLEQFAMYIAALRLADDFGAEAIGIQYQQGLKDLVAASDLAEGLLNNVERPPVRSRDGARVLREGRPLPHFNEVDEGVAVDDIVTNRVWTAMHLDPAITLHDVRWGGEFDGQFVWTFMISGSVPASHLGGYTKAYSCRQPAHFFPQGGGTLSGVSRPGEIVWSRIYVQGGRLHADLGRGTAIELPAAETRRRLEQANPEWPIMHLVMHGVSRDQFMGRHKANHACVVYAPDAATADRALTAKSVMLDALGVTVHLCGDVSLG